MNTARRLWVILRNAMVRRQVREFEQRVERLEAMLRHPSGKRRQ